MHRLTYDLEEENVTVIPVKDYADLRFDGMHFNLIKNRETELPYWIAELLEKEGLVTLVEEQKALHNLLRTVARREQNEASLTDIDSLLIRRVQDHISKLSNQGTTMALRRLTSIEGSLNTILRLRARKILNLVRDDKGFPSNTNMTPEEEWLYRNLNDVYTSWKSNMGPDKSEVE